MIDAYRAFWIQAIFLRDMTVYCHHIQKAYWVKKKQLNDHSIFIRLAFINTLTVYILVSIRIISSPDTLVIQYIHPLRLINAYMSVN